MRSVEAYDSEEKTLSSVADMNETRELCYSVTYNGLLYVLGGYTEWIEETQMQSYQVALYLRKNSVYRVFQKLGSVMAL